MNLSILDLQGQMAGQDFPVRDKQRVLIGQHPQRAVELLQAAGVTDTDWLMAVAQHHERADGTGYPHHLRDPVEMAALLRVADVFMARITPRVLHPAMSVQEATKQMFREDGGGALSTAVIKQVGIYPPGDFVKLASGELAVVVHRTDNVRAPRVAAITDCAERPVAKTAHHDTADPAFAITGNVANKSLLARMPPERLYGFSQLLRPGAAAH